MAAEREDRQQTHQDPIRTTTFVNADAEAAPPFCLLEVTGYDADSNSFTVTRPTRNNLNDLLVNGPVTIDPGEEGQAFLGAWVPMMWADDGDQKVYTGQTETKPAVGDSLGSIAGKWYASRRASGYRVSAEYGQEGDKVVLVRAVNYTLVEYVEITRCHIDADDAPANYSSAQLVYFDPATNAWVYPPTPVYVWYRDESGLPIGTTDPTSGGPCRVRAQLTGTGFGAAVYLGRAAGRCVNCTSGTTTTTTTPPPSTTTPAGCTGECFWEWDNAARRYTFQSSTCSTGCDCLPPNFIPPSTGACPTVTVRTLCGRTGGTSGEPPYCTTSTTTLPGTTTTTTTLSAGCTGCKWAWAFPGWYQVETEAWHCNDNCSCAPPSGPPTGDPCVTYMTPCVGLPPPPPPYCINDCRWFAGYDLAWQLKNYSCQSYGVSDPCTCDPPAYPPGECGEWANTPCYVHSATTTPGDPGPSPLCSTTTPPFGSCNAGCVWQWWAPPFVATPRWVKVFHGCPGCDCSQPAADGTEDCQTEQTPCEQPTTTPPYTTSTTTLPGTTTTTTSPGSPSCNCGWSEYWSYNPFTACFSFVNAIYGMCQVCPGSVGSDTYYDPLCVHNPPNCDKPCCDPSIVSGLSYPPYCGNPYRFDPMPEPPACGVSTTVIQPCEEFGRFTGLYRCFITRCDTCDCCPGECSTTTPGLSTTTAVVPPPPPLSTTTAVVPPPPP